MIGSRIVSAAVLAGAALVALGGVIAQPTPPVPPPAPPPQAFPPDLLYQTRAAEPAGDRLAKGRDGAALFSSRCGYCHLRGGMGTNLLTKQRVAMGEPPAMGMLANRTDLLADYVTAVVRQGKGAMPRQTKVDITDAELDSVAGYLAKGNK